MTITGMLGMAYDCSAGRMFAAREYNRLYYISNMATGGQTLADALNAHVYAICCTTNGRIYGIAGNGSPYSIKKNTGDMTVVGRTGVESVYFRQSIKYDRNAGKAYRHAFNLDIAGRLRKVDLTTDADEALGVLEHTADLAGMFNPMTAARRPTPIRSRNPLPLPRPSPMRRTAGHMRAVPSVLCCRWRHRYSGRPYACSPETLPNQNGTNAQPSIDTEGATDIVHGNHPPMYSAPQPVTTVRYMRLTGTAL